MNLTMILIALVAGMFIGFAIGVAFSMNLKAETYMEINDDF